METEYRRKEYKSLLVLAVVLAASYILWGAYCVGYADGVSHTASEAGLLVCDFGAKYTVEKIEFITGLLLVLGAVGVWLRRLAGLAVAVTSYVGVNAVYLWWYTDTARFIRLNGEDFYYSTPHLWMFRGATWWNVAVLLVAEFILIWAVKVMSEWRWGRAFRR